jgi:hypothetical protein
MDKASAPLNQNMVPTNPEQQASPPNPKYMFRQQQQLL